MKNNDDISLEKYIDVTYPEILKSISKEKYLLDYVKFDLFHEIKCGGEVAGFIALENDDLNNRLILAECYVLPEWRGNNLFFKNYCEIIRNSEKPVFIRKPNRNLINSLLNNNFAFKMPEGVFHLNFSTVN